MNIKALFGMWIFCIVCMIVIILAWPECLRYDCMLAGVVYAILAWIPALGFERGISK